MTYLVDDDPASTPPGGPQMLDELAEANAKLATALAENAGLHAQLLVQAREAGVLDERQRMAGEIHDVLAQGLTGIVTQLEAADAAAGRPGRLAPAPGRGQAAGPRQPHRGPPLGAGAAPAAARRAPRCPTRSPRWSTAGPAHRGARRADHHRRAPGRCCPRSRRPCCGPRRRRWPTWPGTRAAGRVALTLSYMEDW